MRSDLKSASASERTILRIVVWRGSSLSIDDRRGAGGATLKIRSRFERRLIPIACEVNSAHIRKNSRRTAHFRFTYRPCALRPLHPVFVLLQPSSPPPRPSVPPAPSADRLYYTGSAPPAATTRLEQPHSRVRPSAETTTLLRYTRGSLHPGPAL